MLGGEVLYLWTPINFDDFDLGGLWNARNMGIGVLSVQQLRT